MRLPSHTSRLPTLDGLRGVALLCVLAAHAGLPVFGGSLIMFVLSGYLITAHLVRERDRTGRIDVRSFYARRIRRLLPALCVMLASLNLVVPLLHPDAAPRLSADSLAALALVANWTQVLHTHESLLLHLWSLSIQEQVYLVWPLIVASLSRRALLWTCMLLAVCVVGLRTTLVLSGVPLTTIYFATFTRIDGVLLGSALALVPSVRLSVSVGRVLSTACVLILAICLGLYPLRSSLTYLVSMPVVSVCTTLLIALLMQSRTSILSRALSHPVLVYLGTISYGVYLWHYPLIVLLLSVTPHAGIVGGMCGIVAGALSHRLIEAPLLRRTSSRNPSLTTRPTIQNA
jgi:peptidoglycan/LPS O-acetylase OafA/YrhL